MRPRGATEDCICEICNGPFTARVADRKRGWAKTCSKICATKLSNKKTGKLKKAVRAAGIARGK